MPVRAGRHHSASSVRSTAVIWSVLVTRSAASRQAALLELLPAAAGTWVVSSNAFERILVGQAEDWISVGLLPPPLLVLIVLLGEAIPVGQLVDGVAEKRIFVIVRTPRFTRALDAPLEILLEIIESKNVAVNEAPVESLLHQNFQVAEAEHRNGALPADPGIIFGLRLHLHKEVTEKAASQIPIEFSPQDDHGEGLDHAGPEVFIGIRVENDVVERLRIAVE